MIEAEQTTDNPEEQLHRIGQAYLKMGILHPEHFKMMTMGPLRPSTDHCALFETAKKSFYVLLRVIERCQTKKIVGKGNPYHKAMHCWMTVHGYTSLYVNGNLAWLGVTDKNAQKAMRVLTEELLHGISRPLPSSTGFQITAEPIPKNLLEKLKRGE